MSRPITISPETESAIAEEFRGGMSAMAISKMRGLSVQVVKLSLRRSGLRAADNKKMPTPRLDSLEQSSDEIIRLYTMISAEDIATRYGVSQTLVRKLLRRHKVRVHGRGTRLWKYQHLMDQIVARWNDGETKASIAKSFDLHRCTVSKLITVFAPEVKHKGPASGARHFGWKGGRMVTVEGYVLVIISREHRFFEAMRNKTGPAYVLEHRLIMAEYLGRPLAVTEQVHHINGIRHDNRLSNLQMRIGAHGSGRVMRCNVCGSRDVIAVPIGEMSEGDNGISCENSSQA